MHRVPLVLSLETSPMHTPRSHPSSTTTATARTPLLVVEDDDDIRETYAEVLRDEGFDVSEAENGEHALTLLRNGLRPALILLDQTMPIMNGRAFREAQLGDPALAHIPVLLMTAANAVDDLVADLRPQAVVRKPIGFDPLLAAVRAALSH